MDLYYEDLLTMDISSAHEVAESEQHKTKMEKTFWRQRR